MNFRLKSYLGYLLIFIGIIGLYDTFLRFTLVSKIYDHQIQLIESHLEVPSAPVSAKDFEVYTESIPYKMLRSTKIQRQNTYAVTSDHLMSRLVVWVGLLIVAIAFFRSSRSKRKSKGI